MSVAKFKLITSKGVVKSGEPLPSGIPSAEIEAIRSAGGLVEGGNARTKRSAANTAIADAERELAKAKDNLAKAGEDAAAKAAAESAVAEAEEALAELRA